MEDNSTELADRADRLAVAVDGLTKVITVLEARDSRRRLQMAALALSILLDISLSGGFFYSLGRTNDAQVRAAVAQSRASEAQERTDKLFIEVRRATTAAIAICEARNHQSERLEDLLGEPFPQQDCTTLGEQR